MYSFSSHLKQVFPFPPKQSILLVVCSLCFCFVAAPALAYVDFLVNSVKVNGPYSHIKGSVSPTLSVSVGVGMDTSDTLFCEETVSVSLDLRRGPESLHTVVHIFDICDLAQNLNFPLEGINTLGLDNQYSIQVTVDPVNAWDESNELNNVLDSAFFPYGVLSGKLNFGTIATTLQSGLLDHSPVGCSTSLSLFSAYGHWDIEGDWPQVPYASIGELCINSTTAADNYSLDLSVPSGSAVSTGTINSTAPIDGFGISLTGTSLGSDGLDVDQVILTMPDNVTIHREMVLNPTTTPTTWIDPHGNNTLIVHPIDQVTHPELITGLYEAGDILFHDYSLPFYIRATGADIDFTGNDGLHLTDVTAEGIHWRPAVNMEDNDSRKRLSQIFPDNRNFFILGGSTGQIFIDGSGIQGGFSFTNSGEFGSRRAVETSFPHALISWENFDTTVQNGRIQPTFLTITTFDMNFNTACPDNLCEGGVLPVPYSFPDLEGVLSLDGALGSRTTMPADTGWGQYAHQDYTFERVDNNLPAFLYMPGSVVTGSSASPGTPEQHTIFQYLLGSRNYTNVPFLTANTLNYLDSSESVKGNDYFAGVTLGPQYLSNGNNEVETGLTTILEAPQFIFFRGQEQADTFGVNFYSKYVFRPGGLTGVFNLTPPPIIEIYGYDLFMHRFAFRQVLNRIDKRTFIDGKLDLPFPAVVTPYFIDLDLSCSGDFGQGMVDSEACDLVDNDNDGILNEGCYQNYSYWNIPIEYLAIGFAPDDPTDLCGNRQLSLTVSQDFERLNKKLQHTAFWSSQGVPSKDSMSGPAELTIDAPVNKDGFPVQIQTGYLNRLANYSGQDGGFANLVSRVGLPLFNAPVAHTHIRNSKDGDTGIIAMFKDETNQDGDRNGVPDIASYGNATEYRTLALNSDPELSPSDPRLRAKYNWPSSNVLKLDYPLNYQPGQSDTVPRFNGVKQETFFLSNVTPLLKSNTVPDFLEPDNLRISIGVSADMAFLKDLTLDIRSPNEVNTFFNSLSPPLNIDISTYIGSLSDSKKKMDSMTGDDLSPFFRETLGTALDSGAAAQPMENLAASLSIIQTSPYALSSLVTSRVDGLVKAVIERTGNNATSLSSEQLTNLYNNMAACTLFAGDATQQARLLLEIENNTIQDMGGLTKADVEEYFNQLNGIVQHVSELRELIVWYQTKIKKNRAAVLELRQNVFSTNVSTPRSNLDSALTAMQTFQDNSTDNPFFTPVTTAQNTLGTIRNDIAQVSLTDLGQALKTGALGASASLDISQLPDMERLLKSRVAELDTLLTEADTLLRSKMTSLTFPTVFDTAKARLLTMEQQADSIRAAVITAANMALEPVNGDAFTKIDTILKWYERSLNAMLGVLNQGLDAEQTINTANNSWSELVILGKSSLDKTASAELSQASSSLKISLSGSTTPFISYWKLLAMLNTPLNGATKNFRNTINAADETAEKFIPAPRSTDIRNIIVTDVMNSVPVTGLNTLFHDQFVHMTSYIDMMTGEITGQANRLIKQTVAAIDDSLQQQLKGEKVIIGDFNYNNDPNQPAFGNGGISVTGLTGHATIRQNEISRFHMEGDFDINAQPSSTTYSGVFDITPWNGKNGKGDCGLGVASTGMVDATISTHDVPINILDTTATIKDASLGFTLEGTQPVGIHGKLYLSGEIGFEALVLYDMGLEAGIGKTENYFGAKCAGRFDAYQIKAAFYLGKSCRMQVLGRLDPEITEFIGSRPSITGVYARGGTSFPVYDNGCVLRVGVGAEIGAWLFAEDPVTYGGLMGGSVYGQAVCIGSVKGKLTMIGGKTGDIFKFTGHGWAAAGIGFCGPSGWDSVSDSRADSWCLTGDATFRGKATAKTSGSDVNIDIDTPDVNCCY